MPTLAADAALFHSAERSGGIRDKTSVEADHPSLEAFGYAKPSSDVGGVEIRDQAVLGVVCHGDGLVLVVKDDDGSDRAEDLRLENL